MYNELMCRIDKLSAREQVILAEILQEYEHPEHKYPGLGTKEQAYGLLLGEIVESWEPIKSLKLKTQNSKLKTQNSKAAHSQIKAVAAIALKFMVELL